MPGELDRRLRPAHPGRPASGEDCHCRVHEVGSQVVPGKLTEIEDAAGLVLSRAHRLGSEMVPLREALGRVLAQDVRAPRRSRLRQLGDGRLRRARRRPAGATSRGARDAAARRRVARRPPGRGPVGDGRGDRDLDRGDGPRRAPTRSSGSRTRRREDGGRRRRSGSAPGPTCAAPARTSRRRPTCCRGQRARRRPSSASSPRSASIGSQCARRPRVAVLTTRRRAGRARGAAARPAASATRTPTRCPALVGGPAPRSATVAAPRRAGGHPRARRARRSRRRPRRRLRRRLGRRARPRQGRARGARRRAGLLGVALQPASRPGSGAGGRTARSSSGCPATRSRRWSPSCSSPGRRCCALGGADPASRRTTAPSTSDYEKPPGRAHAVRCRARAERGRLARPAGPRPGLARAHLDARRRCLALIAGRSDAGRGAGERVEVELLDGPAEPRRASMTHDGEGPALRDAARARRPRRGRGRARRRRDGRRCARARSRLPRASARSLGRLPVRMAVNREYAEPGHARWRRATSWR